MKLFSGGLQPLKLSLLNCTCAIQFSYTDGALRHNFLMLRKIDRVRHFANEFLTRIKVRKRNFRWLNISSWLIFVDYFLFHGGKNGKIVFATWIQLFIICYNAKYVNCYWHLTWWRPANASIVYDFTFPDNIVLSND